MRTLITLLLATCLLAANAQRVSINEDYGTPFKTKGPSIVDIYELEGGGYWSISSRIEGAGLFGLGFVRMKMAYYVQRYDEDLTLIEEKRFDLKMDDKVLSLKRIIEFKDEYYAFMSFDNELTQKTYLFYGKINTELLAIEGDLTKVAEIDLGNKRNQMRPGRFDISVSDNDEFLVIFGRQPRKIEQRKRRGFGRAQDDDPEVGTYAFEFTYWVLDDQFDVVNSKENHVMEIENSTDVFYVRDYTVDDNGSIYILGKNKITDDLTRRERRERGVKKWVDINKSAFVIEKIDREGNAIQNTTPEGELFVDMDILFDNEGNINLVGLTGEQVYSHLMVTGVYRVVMDHSNLETLTEASSKFSDDVIENVNRMVQREENASQRKKRRIARKESKMSEEEKEYNEARKRAIEHVDYIKFSDVDENGDAYIVLEEEWVEVVTTTTTDANGNTTTTTTYYYHYDDLVMVKFIGEEVLQNYYSKSFTRVNVPLRTSLEALVKDGDLQIITYNHIVKANEDLSKVRSTELETFDRKERVKGMRRRIFNYRKTINDNTILVAAQWKRKILWHRITFK